MSKTTDLGTAKLTFNDQTLELPVFEGITSVAPLASNCSMEARASLVIQQMWL